MTNETKYVITGLAVIVLVILGATVIRKFTNKGLSNGKITQEQTNTNPENMTTPQVIKGKPQVEFNTSKGKFVLELRPDVAPKTVANFLGKWSNNYCDNLTFHRVEDWVVQGCDPKGDGTGGASNLPTETSSESFVTGALGVARKAFPKEVSNDSQFFVVKKDSLFLDNEYTYFGKVISGMDVINAIAVGDKILSTTILSK